MLPAVLTQTHLFRAMPEIRRRAVLVARAGRPHWQPGRAAWIHESRKTHSRAIGMLLLAKNQQTNSE
jgi:hypothetical protein